MITIAKRFSNKSPIHFFTTNKNKVVNNRVSLEIIWSKVAGQFKRHWNLRRSGEIGWVGSESFRYFHL